MSKLERKTRKKEKRQLTAEEIEEIEFQKELKREHMRTTINQFFSDEDEFRNDITLIEMGLSRDTLGFAMTDYLELVFYAVCKVIEVRNRELQIEDIREYLDNAPL